jgi:hypothetical protein
MRSGALPLLDSWRRRHLSYCLLGLILAANALAQNSNTLLMEAVPSGWFPVAVDVADGDHAHLKAGDVVNLNTRSQAYRGIQNAEFEFHGANSKSPYTLRIILPPGKTMPEKSVKWAQEARDSEVWIRSGDQETVVAKIKVPLNGVPQVRTISLPPIKGDTFSVGVRNVTGGKDVHPGVVGSLAVFSTENKPLGAPEVAKTDASRINLDGLLNPANWSQPWTRKGNWEFLGRKGDEESAFLFNQAHMQGLDPVYVQIRTKAGLLNRVDVVYAEQSLFDQNQTSGNTKYQLAKNTLVSWETLLETITQKANADLTRWFGNPTKVTIDHGTQIKQDALQYMDKNRKICVRFIRLPGLVKLQIEPGWAASNLTTNRAGFPTDSLSRSKALKAAVEHKENGDTVIPLMGCQQIGPYCARAVVAMAANQMGMEFTTFDVANLDHFSNFIPGSRNEWGVNVGKNIGDIMHARFNNVWGNQGIKAWKIQRLIDQGIPIIVWRTFSWSRMAKQVEAAKASPLGTPEPLIRKNWPKPDPKNPDVDGHASIISGYNKARDEVLITESWGADRVNGERMRTDEILATAFLFQWWEP